MKRHTTDEGWQIFAGLESSGYRLCGRALPVNETSVPKILEQTDPGIVVMQDKREWDVAHKDFRDKKAYFENVGVLANRPDLFKLTILKDCHQRPGYHMESAQEINCHAWIVYYHHSIVKHLASYVRHSHLIRTHHSLDITQVPIYSPHNRRGALLSGAVSSVYPLRQRLIHGHRHLTGVEYHKHPGYHMRGSHTPSYLKLLCQYKVAICTSSIYGYALRKIIEATACGCVVVTDLPTDDILPEVEHNLVRVDPAISLKEMDELLRQLYSTYNPEFQKEVATATLRRYSHIAVGQRLAADIEKLRGEYASPAR